MAQSNAVHASSEELPSGFVLEQNYPNPFNPSTTVDFGMATLKVYDMLGREVRTLVNEELKPGSYEMAFDFQSQNA